MKSSDILAVLAATLSVVEAHSHEHGRRHTHGRKARAVDVVNVPETVVTYELDGKTISKEDVCKGIADGTLIWPPGADRSVDCAAKPASSSSVAEVAAPTPKSKAKAGAELLEKPIESEPSSSSSSEAAAPTPAKPKSKSKSDLATGVISGLTGYAAKIASNPNTDKEFEDGVVDCGDFPEAYGAIPIDWVHLDGYSGIQYVTIEGEYATDVDTAIAGDKCEEKNDGRTTFCSYSCPPGYQKSQWPSEQGPEGKALSIGGLKCENGKLHLTNPTLSKKLCIKGNEKVKVKNEMSGNSPICRTDYPGIEKQTVPLDVQPGQESPLTCPQAAKYYTWLGMQTTAQYYINPKNTPVDIGCDWSYDGSHVGNWAPINLGVGEDKLGKTWLSIASTKQNNPISWKELDFNIELQGDFGGDNACFYVFENNVGYYCSKGTPKSHDKSNCKTQDTAAVPGCTVNLMSGVGTYVLTDA